MTANGTTARPEMTIPKSRREVIFHFVMSAIVVFFSLVAIANLCFRVAWISSTIWLAIVLPSLWGACRRAGGLRRFLADQLAVFVGRYFVDCPPPGVQPVVVRFGYQLFGRRYLQREVAIEKIESQCLPTYRWIDPNGDKKVHDLIRGEKVAQNTPNHFPALAIEEPDYFKEDRRIGRESGSVKKRKDPKG